MIELEHGSMQATIVPEMGAGLASLDWRGVPVLRAWDGTSLDPGSLASFLLVPWSNRISGGGLEAGGRFWPLEPNELGEPYPIHGDGWLKPWTPVELAPDAAVLALHSEVGPYRYRARVSYALAHNGVEQLLEVIHLGEVSAPYGLGFHPYFPRTPATTLRAPASGVWLDTGGGMPTVHTPIGEVPSWNFAGAAALPAGLVDNGFSGWNGRARMRWPDRGLQVEIEADPALSTYILYSPTTDADFFCFEPVTHPIDACHLPGQPGLVLLEPGERMAVGYRLDVRPD
ncbi:MAG: aldose 1-epimerase [Geminicoccaceae bacterium]